MKRSEIQINFDDYLNTVRKAQKMMTLENSDLVEIGLVDRDKANAQWAALFDLQNLLILMKRAGVSIKEIEEWVQDASAIRLGFSKDATQKKLF